jgi:hypothetical protein
MREGKPETKEILITDSSIIFEALLMYIYTSALISEDFNMDQMVELLLLADRYLLFHLKSLCEKRLKAFITTKTVMHLYDVCIFAQVVITLFSQMELGLADNRQISERSQAEQLKHSCVKFTAKYFDVFEPKELSDTLAKEVQLLLETDKPKGIYYYY